MKILFVTSECAPYSKSGGLADVAFSLPPALKNSGNEVEIITPYYRCVKDRFHSELQPMGSLQVALGERKLYCGLFKGELSGVPVWFLDNMELFDREKLYGYDDDKFRFAWFSKAVIDVLNRLDFVPEILHCNDWESALAVIYLKDDQARRPDYRNIRTVYTIHNIAYQGICGFGFVQDFLSIPDGCFGLMERFGQADFLKAGVVMADRGNTVSPSYAREICTPEFSEGLDGDLSFRGDVDGITNGIDKAVWNPSKDPHIPVKFSKGRLLGKVQCKTALMEETGLEIVPTRPLIGMVTRLVEQKGIDLIREILPDLMDMGVQLIIFGQGDETYTQYFRQCAARYPGQLGFSSDYTEQMASEIFAGADFYLMPSRFEPCGLSQMMAMRCGTVPIVHETGGLKDSVRPYSRFDGIGDGFSFSDYQSKDLLLAIQEALKVYFADEKTFTLLRKRCIQKDFSWLRSAEEYTRMYARISDDAAGDAVPFEDAYAQLRDAFIALDRENRVRNQDRIDPKYHRVIQFHITGRTDGVLHVSFSNGELEVVPAACDSADAYITAAFDQLLNMANGTISFDRLFLTGQLKVEGNLSKGAEIRQLLGKTGI